MATKRKQARSSTKAFGSGVRESHDSSAFYERFSAPVICDDETVVRDIDFLDGIDAGECFVGDSREMSQIVDNSIALVVTSPPYFVGKEYEIDLAENQDVIPASYTEYLRLLGDVFTECYRVLEPGGRICVNVANLGRKPYRSLSADVVSILQDQLGFLLRGEIIWEKSKTSSGSCAWGSFAKASNPVIRDMTERVIVASKGRFDRALDAKKRQAQDLPHISTLSNDEFMDATTDVWSIAPASAKRVGHPAPFPIALPERLINLYTYKDDVVLDPFCGAGTTLLAAAKSGRIGIGFDTEPSYVELANQRLDEFCGADKLFQVDSTDQYSSAVTAGKKFADLAELHLARQGFGLDSSAKAANVDGVSFDLVATNKKGEARLVLLAGGFLIDQPGLASTQQTLSVIGKASLAQGVKPKPVLVLTAALPKVETAAAKAIDSAVAQGILEIEAIEIG